MNLVGLMNNKNENLMNKIVMLMETDSSVDAPADSIKWAKNIFRTRAVEPKKSLMRKVLAVLQMDLSPNKAAFGERSAASSQARQMLFSAGEIGIDLRISEIEKGFNLCGQILGEGFANCTINLGKFEAKSNELSEFSFTEVPSGEYNLILKSDESEIVIESLEIK